MVKTKITSGALLMGLAATTAVTSPVRAAEAAPAAIAAAPSMEGEAELEKAWQGWYAAVGKVHDATLASETYRVSPGQRAAGYYALLEAQAMAYNFTVAPQLASPRLFAATGWQTELYTLGGNSADFQYRTLFLDGALTYKLTVRMNDSTVLLADWSGVLPGTKAYKPSNNYRFNEFTPNPDGTIEVTLSAKKPASGNWIELDPDVGMQWILFRPMTPSYTGRPAEMHVERTSPVDLAAYRAKERSPAAVAQRISYATAFLNFVVNWWNVGYYDLIRKNSGGVNVLKTLGIDISGDASSPAAQYMMGNFEIKGDEAIVVEFDAAPPGKFWSLQLFDGWLKSMDFRTRQSSLNLAYAKADPDGKFRFVLAASDPGYANWLDTTGVDRGFLVLRNYVSPVKIPSPKMTVVKTAKLSSAMPKNAGKVTAPERAAALRERTMGYELRLGE